MVSDLLTTAQASKVLGVHPHTVRRWADRGSLPFVRTPGGQRRFRSDDLDAFLASMEPAS